MLHPRVVCAHNSELSTLNSLVSFVTYVVRLFPSGLDQRSNFSDVKRYTFVPGCFQASRGRPAFPAQHSLKN
jgi:hypothetical protein